MFIEEPDQPPCRFPATMYFIRIHKATEVISQLGLTYHNAIVIALSCLLCRQKIRKECGSISIVKNLRNVCNSFADAKNPCTRSKSRWSYQLVEILAGSWCVLGVKLNGDFTLSDVEKVSSRCSMSWIQPNWTKFHLAMYKSPALCRLPWRFLIRRSTLLMVWSGGVDLLMLMQDADAVNECKCKASPFFFFWSFSMRHRKDWFEKWQ